ncbi:MAG: T9SS type A sorting domain-containing protein [Bacteroidales bacterium]|nr:T9SS type A sorting domain-containing protein [Bacteroidales bacterium]
MKHKLYLLSFFLVLILSGFSQSSKNIYFSGIDNARATSIAKNNDRYLISCVSRSDIPNKNCVKLFEILESGKIKWYVNFSSEYSMEVFDVEYSLNNQIGITGYFWNNFYLHDSYMYILDINGNIENTKFSDDYMLGFGLSVNQDTDGGLSFSGYTANSDIYGGQAYIMKTNNSGNLLWEKKYGGINEEQIFSHIQTLDGGYLMVGSMNGFMFNLVWKEFNTINSDMFVLRTNAEGDSLWSRTFSGSYNSWARCVLPAPNGDFFVLGSTQNLGAGSFDMYLTKINDSGEIVWEKTYGGEDFDYGYDMCLSIDNELILCGVSKSNITTSVDVFVVKTDLDGNTIWEKRIGEEADEYAFGVEPTASGGCILVGQTNDVFLGYGDGSFDILVLKLDQDGEIDEDFSLSGYDAFDFEVMISPNPASDIISVEIIENDFKMLNNYWIKLIDMNGKEVLRRKVKNNTNIINISHLSRGIYLLVVEMGHSNRHVEKLILQ